MVFRGRERFRREVAFEVFKSIMDQFGTRVKVERPPSMDGRHMVMILSAAKDAFDDVVVKASVESTAAAPSQPAHDERTEPEASPEAIVQIAPPETVEAPGQA